MHILPLTISTKIIGHPWTTPHTKDPYATFNNIFTNMIPNTIYKHLSFLSQTSLNGLQTQTLISQPLIIFGTTPPSLTPKKLAYSNSGIINTWVMPINNYSLGPSYTHPSPAPYAPPQNPIHGNIYYSIVAITTFMLSASNTIIKRSGKFGNS
jgi:hypothetical protein